MTKNPFQPFIAEAVELRHKMRHLDRVIDAVAIRQFAMQSRGVHESLRNACANHAQYKAVLAEIELEYSGASGAERESALAYIKSMHAHAAAKEKAKRA